MMVILYPGKQIEQIFRQSSSRESILDLAFNFYKTWDFVVAGIFACDGDRRSWAQDVKFAVEMLYSHCK
jgi:hypothetical protein